MKIKNQYKIKNGRKAYGICFLWILIGLSGLFGCSKTEEYVVAVEENDPVIDGENEADITYETEEMPDGTKAAETVIYVDVCGAVRYPGVYRLDGDARVFEAVDLAGGMTEAACIQAINQAETLTDGQKIYVPTTEEWNAGIMTDEMTEPDDGRININTADVSLLCTLPGIGETRAQAIVAYRESHGSFESVEAIQQVSGIKSGVYDKIKDFIKVQ